MKLTIHENSFGILPNYKHITARVRDAFDLDPVQESILSDLIRSQRPISYPPLGTWHINNPPLSVRFDPGELHEAYK